MKTAIIAVSRAGISMAEMLQRYLGNADIFVPPRLAAERQDRRTKLKSFDRGFKTGIARIFSSYRALVFISAAAVAVRAIAPGIKSKTVDPAVVVIDERGRWVISLLSGHTGGANDLAKDISTCIGAEAVITTATDGRGLPAFDALARQWGWIIENLPDLKKISASLLEEKQVTLFSRQPFNLELEGNIHVTSSPEDLLRETGGVVIVSNRESIPEVLETVPRIILRPRNIIAGVGCRKGTPPGLIVDKVQKSMKETGVAPASLACLASINLKADEKGLQEAADKMGVFLQVYRPEEIEEALQYEALKETRRSAFVKEVVGVEAVAEPCAFLAGEGGTIILPVIKENGVTVSLVEGELFFTTES